MKNKMKGIIWILYFIVGYIIFTVLFLLTHITILNSLGFKGSIAKIYTDSFVTNLTLYTIIYFILVVLNLIYNITTTKKLNKKLNKMKERSEENEK